MSPSAGVSERTITAITIDGERFEFPRAPEPGEGGDIACGRCKAVQPVRLRDSPIRRWECWSCHAEISLEVGD